MVEEQQLLTTVDAGLSHEPVAVQHLTIRRIAAAEKPLHRNIDRSFIHA
jgi:hypothetical protein